MRKPFVIHADLCNARCSDRLDKSKLLRRPPRPSGPQKPIGSAMGPMGSDGVLGGLL